jgi:hypothetical protein
MCHCSVDHLGAHLKLRESCALLPVEAKGISYDLLDLGRFTRERIGPLAIGVIRVDGVYPLLCCLCFHLGTLVIAFYSRIRCKGGSVFSLTIKSGT